MGDTKKLDGNNEEEVPQLNNIKSAGVAETSKSDVYITVLGVEIDLERYFQKVKRWRKRNS